VMSKKLVDLGMGYCLASRPATAHRELLRLTSAMKISVEAKKTWFQGTEDA
jgi:hypothetical protein